MSKHSVVIKWSDQDNGFIAMIPELEGLSAFGDTPDEAVQELSEAKELYLEVLKEDGEEIPEPDLLKPYSGQIRLRLPRELHASLSEKARQEGISLNTYLVYLLSERNAYKQVKTDIALLKSSYTYAPATQKTVFINLSSKESEGIPATAEIISGFGHKYMFHG
jgi:predicted RNase H-like HicB family nuclease